MAANRTFRKVIDLLTMSAHRVQARGKVDLPVALARSVNDPKHTLYVVLLRREPRRKQTTESRGARASYLFPPLLKSPVDNAARHR